MFTRLVPQVERHYGTHLRGHESRYQITLDSSTECRYAINGAVVDVPLKHSSSSTTLVLSVLERLRASYELAAKIPREQSDMSLLAYPAPLPSSFPSYPDLRDKVALITGVGQVGIPNSSTWGNGAATARILAHSGAKIFGCDLSLKAAEYTARRLRDDNSNSIIDVTVCDVTRGEEVERMVQECMSRHGRIDILVNNVGMTAPGDPGSMSEEVWDQQIQLNLKSVFLVSRCVLPIMEKQGGGTIVNNTSLTAIRYIGKPQIGYASAKAAVVQYTKTTGCMYAKRGVRVNAVIPGLMYTPLVENLGASDNEVDKEVFRKITQHNVPMGKMGTGHDVGMAVTFLCSDAARYITATTLVVDGGLAESTGTGGL